MIDLRLGDCAEVLMTLPPGSVDLTVTSPPYDNLRTYKGYTFDFEKIARGLWYATKPGGVVVWVVADATIDGSETGTSFRQALYFMSLGFNLHDTMIYQMPGTGAKGSNLSYWQAFEYMFVLSKGRPKTVNRLQDKVNKSAGHLNSSGKKRLEIEPTRLVRKPFRTAALGFRTNIWSYGTGNRHGDVTAHPAPMPEKMALDHILSWSNPGDVVLDPMMGSGTTGKMAVLNDRNFIGIEIAREYYEIAQRRITEAQQQIPLPLAEATLCQ